MPRTDERPYFAASRSTAPVHTCFGSSLRVEGEEGWLPSANGCGYRARRVKTGSKGRDERMHGSNREPVSRRKGLLRGYQGCSRYRESESGARDFRFHGAFIVVDT